MLYATCATVQGIKIKNFFSVTERRWLRPLAWIGLLFATIIMALFIMHCVFLIWFPGKKALTILGIISLIWSSCLMLPLLHYMVLRHSRHVPDAEDLMESQRNSFKVSYSPSANGSPNNVQGSNALW
jgi:predicted MFS family arabinose efflux permease